MKLISIKILTSGFIFIGSIILTSGAGVEDGQAPLKPPPLKKTAVFSLLPKAFQSNPELSITVITEATEEGKKLKPPTTGKPAYYQAVASGYHHEGHGKDQDKTLSVEHLEKQLKKSLVEGGYLEADKDHPPSLVLFFVWGTHNKLAEDDPASEMGGQEDIGYRNLLSRAALVGGKQFAEELAAAIEEQSNSASGDIMLNPVYRLMIRSDRNRALMHQIVDDCYYVVVSAYDLASFAHGEKKLLWRTKMTTAAAGISLAESSSALVAGGGPFFGRWMTEPAIVDKRISRNGRVELGETRTISMDEPVGEPEKKNVPTTGKK
ncbi:MAG: hypothetical protein QM715_09160 [Nibricoccus sp.]